MVKASDGFGRLADRFQQLIPNLREAMDDAVQSGAETWVDVIETSGTDKQWKSRWRGGNGEWRTGTGRGRIDTGHMRDSMEGEVTLVTTDRIEGRIGWGNKTEPYMIYQDVGFTHNITGEHIAGMQGKREALQESVEVLLDGVKDVIRRTL